METITTPAVTATPASGIPYSLSQAIIGLTVS